MQTPRLRIAMFCRMPPNLYSGGRYFALIMMEALSQAGHETYLISNNKPMFYREFEELPHHNDIQYVHSPTFDSGLPDGQFNLVVLVPDSGVDHEEFFWRAECFALSRKAHLVLLNFESGNWYNSLSPVPRDLKMWDPWRAACQSASLVLSISKEGSRWAQDFYQMPPGGRFDFCYPSVNTRAADAVPDSPTENRMLLFTRFSTAEHKGGYQLPSLFCEAMLGWTLTIVIGAGEMPIQLRADLAEAARRFGVQIELKYRLTDTEKFAEYKRSKLLLFPSYFEGFGYPPVESLYCNVPCIAFDLPVLRETCGDALIYANHGDWNDFRTKLAQFLVNPPVFEELRDVVRNIATLEAHETRLDDIFRDLAAKSPDNVLKRCERWVRLRYRLVIGDSLGDFPYFVLKVMFRPLAEFLREKISARRGNNGASTKVVYYPRFCDPVDLTNHYFRACWYLPFTPSRCETVELFSGAIELGARPEHMGDSPSDSSHIRIRRSFWRLGLALFQADTILLWKEGKRSLLLRLAQRLCSNRVINVTTNDLSIKEYGVYCSLIWNYLTPPIMRNLILQENRERFVRVVTELQKTSYENACVFGTGPSLEQAPQFDFSKSLNIVCNSIVQSAAYMKLIKPKFICAGDVVSHLGVSAYAARFREDLLHTLDEQDCFFVTTASFGSLLLLHYPRYADRVILINQTTNQPNYNLLVHFGAPRLDSTLNIHMLPIAATIAKNIWMLGCDGRVEARSNEDFWAHASGAQYLDLVQSSHLCHPTFDVHRQETTYERFLESISVSVLLGESNHGIRYRTLCPSNIPVLKTRNVNLDVSSATKPIPIEHLGQQEPGVTPQPIKEYRRPQNNGAELITRVGIFECYLDPDNILFVRGWALAAQEIDRVAIYSGNSFLGTANLGLGCMEILQEYPEYNADTSGFQFVYKSDVADVRTIRLLVFCGPTLLEEKEVDIALVP